MKPAKEEFRDSLRRLFKHFAPSLKGDQLRAAVSFATNVADKWLHSSSGERDKVLEAANLKAVEGMTKLLGEGRRVRFPTVSPVSRGQGMTKAELVDKIARDSGISQKAAEMALSSFIAGVRESLRKGKKVTLVGFGTFAAPSRAARSIRHPQTGDAIKIKAARVPRFKAAKALKHSVK